MRQRHMQQAQRQGNSRRRELHAGQKRPRHQQDDAEFEPAEGTEIGGHPFEDEMEQFAETVSDTMRQASPNHRVSCSMPRMQLRRMRASAMRGANVVRSRVPDRVEPEASHQHQPKHEAAVEVCPRRQQRQQPWRRRLAPLAGGRQSARPSHHERQRQHMRSRVEVRHRDHECGECDQDRIAGGDAARQNRGQQRECRGNGRGGETVGPAQPAILGQGVRTCASHDEEIQYWSGFVNE